MGMDGVMYGYVVRNLRKPKKDFCLSIVLDCVLCGQPVDRGMLKRLTEVVGKSNLLNATRYLKLVVVKT